MSLSVEFDGKDREISAIYCSTQSGSSLKLEKSLVVNDTGHFLQDCFVARSHLLVGNGGTYLG